MTIKDKKGNLLTVQTKIKVFVNNKDLFRQTSTQRNVDRVRRFQTREGGTV